jgi:hypothetical protein
MLYPASALLLIPDITVDFFEGIPGPGQFLFLSKTAL